MSRPEREFAHDVTVRLLPSDEYVRLLPLFFGTEGALPDPAISRIAVAEDSNGDIIGFFILQLVAHAEPIWVAEDYQRRGVAKMLIDEINALADAQGTPYFSFAEGGRVAELALKNGMQQLEYRVFYRRPKV